MSAAIALQCRYFRCYSQMICDIRSTFNLGSQGTKQYCFPCETRVSHGGEDVNVGVLGCNTLNMEAVSSSETLVEMLLPRRPTSIYHFPDDKGKCFLSVNVLLLVVFSMC
jgi:hypothetical protein